MAHRKPSGRSRGRIPYVDWLTRIRRISTVDHAALSTTVAQPVERALPGITALLDGVGEDRTHAVLDLGPASDSSLRVYGRFARWVRFMDLLGGATWPQAPGPAAGSPEVRTPRMLLPRLDRSYDLVFTWDTLDGLFPENRPRLVEWLADTTVLDARIHIVVRASEDVLTRPLRFTFLDVDRIRYEPSGTTPVPGPRLLPADVAKLLTRFEVVHAFTLRAGLREYVAVRR